MPNNEPLHRLPNGEWISLELITTIVPQQAADHARVVVVCGGAHHTLEFASFGNAQAYADELAALVNAVRREADDA